MLGKNSNLFFGAFLEAWAFAQWPGAPSQVISVKADTIALCGLTKDL